VFLTSRHPLNRHRFITLYTTLRYHKTLSLSSKNNISAQHFFTTKVVKGSDILLSAYWGLGYLDYKSYQVGFWMGFGDGIPQIYS